MYKLQGFVYECALAKGPIWVVLVSVCESLKPQLHLVLSVTVPPFKICFIIQLHLPFPFWRFSVLPLFSVIAPTQFPLRLDCYKMPHRDRFRVQELKEDLLELEQEEKMMIRKISQSCAHTSVSRSLSWERVSLRPFGIKANTQKN